MSIGKKTPDNLRRFAMELNKSRADNVAFLIDGTRSDATDVINAVAEAGANVCDENCISISDFRHLSSRLLPMI